MTGVEIQRLRNQVTIVIPTLNEEEAIGRLIDEVRAAGYDKILVVGGYSTDRTSWVAAEHGAKVAGQHGKLGQFWWQETFLTPTDYF